MDIIHEPNPGTTFHLDGLDLGGGLLGDYLQIKDIGGGVLRWRPETATSGSASLGMRPKIGPGGTIVWDYEYYVLPFMIDGGGSVIQLGYKGLVPIATAGVIVACEVIDASSTPTTGDFEADVLKGTFASHPPATSIVGAAPPTIVASDQSLDPVLPGWSPNIAVGDRIGIEVVTVTNFTRLMLALIVRKD